VAAYDWLQARERYLNDKRARQALHVAQHIGPLLDAWYSIPNDAMSALQDECPELCAHMKAIGQCMDR
jgi:hypothetical protein